MFNKIVNWQGWEWKGWNSVSAIATLLMTGATFLIIFQTWKMNIKDENNNRLLNRAYVSTNGFNLQKCEKSICPIEFVNTGNTLALGLKYSIYYTSNTNKKKYLQDDVLIGILNPSQTTKELITFTNDFLNGVTTSTNSTFYFQVNYITYYGDCVTYNIPMQFMGIDKEKNNIFRTQSVEENKC